MGGEAGFVLTATIVRSGGSGGGTPFGGGSDGRITAGAGQDATKYGCGGGAAVSIGAGNNVGGVGSQGVIIVYEYQ
jgi:hypothetical protein